MFGLLLKGLPFLGKLLGNPLELVKSIFGSKEKRDDAKAEMQGKVYDQFAQEFKQPSNWFDSLINGLNRLPRPFGFFLTVWMFVWPLFDLASFVDAMNAYTLFPEWLGLLITGVWGFYFAGRLLTKDMKFGEGISNKKLQNYLAAQKELSGVLDNRRKTDNVSSSQVAPSSQEKLTDKDFQVQMKSSKPLSLPAIEEWNRRRSATQAD